MLSRPTHPATKAAAPIWKAKSLFANILHLSRLDPRFCGNHNRPMHTTAIESIVCRNRKDEAPNSNSLFRNILPLSPFDPRFYRNKTRYGLANSKGINILPRTTKKKRVPLSTKSRFQQPAPPLLEFHLWMSLHAA